MSLANPDLDKEKLNAPELKKIIIAQIKYYNWILVAVQNKKLDELLDLIEEYQNI